MTTNNDLKTDNGEGKLPTILLLALLCGLFMAVATYFVLSELIPDGIAITIFSFQERPIDKGTLIIIGAVLGFGLGYNISEISMKIYSRPPAKESPDDQQ